MTNVKKEEKQNSTVADQIWGDIKERPISMFSLPLQVVANHCQPTPIEPTKLYLTFKTPAFLPALEAVISDRYTCELSGRFIVVNKK